MSIKGTVRTINSSFIWEIKEFSSLQKNGYFFVQSPPHEIENINWCLKLYTSQPRNPEENDDSLTLQVQPLINYGRNNRNQKTVSFQIAVLNKNGKKVIRTILCQYSFDNLHLNGALVFPKFISKNILAASKDSLLFEDKLTILCEYCNGNEFNNSLIKTDEEVANDFEKLFTDKNYSDFTIIIEDKKLSAHKSILSVRSKVFADIIKHKENDIVDENVLDITDTSFEVMVEVLRFIYSGKVQNMEKLVNPLIIAADKYGLSKLKLMCEEFLCKDLNAKNVIKMIDVAETNDCKKLKSEAINYIVINMTDFVKTDDFQTLKESNPKLLEEIVTTIAKRKVNVNASMHQVYCVPHNFKVNN